MCAATRFPEAIPLSNIRTPAICEAQKMYFSKSDLAKSIRSDQGSNFQSNQFKQFLKQLGIEQHKSSAWHPQSQGALERFHQTFKTMLKTYCLSHDKDWDIGVPLLLFAVRDSVQESLGFSPFELVFGHNVSGPLKMIKEKWLKSNDETDLLSYITTFKERLASACDSARKHKKTDMKVWYDKEANMGSFNVGDKVLVLLPIPTSPLHAKYLGPYVIEKKLNDLNYVVKTPDRRKNKQMCHVNMIETYFTRVMKGNGVFSEHPSMPVVINNDPNACDFVLPDSNVKLQNSNVLSDLMAHKLTHLTPSQQDEIQELVLKNRQLFSDVPGGTNAVFHDIELLCDTPINQHAYRVSPQKQEVMKKEINYMVENNIIEKASSAWSSLCILVPKPDKSFRFCTDFRRVHSITKTDTFPIPRVDDCIDRIGHVKYVSKFDMLIGYWQVPLREKAKEITAFTIPGGLYRYQVMAFGLKNAGATFQRLSNEAVDGLEDTDVYGDAIIVYSNDWESHIIAITALFEILAIYGLTVNLVKSDFGQATVSYLGHVVGCGQVAPLKAKVESINNFPTPTCKKSLMSFLGLAGFYRKLYILQKFLLM